MDRQVVILELPTVRMNPQVGILDYQVVSWYQSHVDSSGNERFQNQTTYKEVCMKATRTRVEENTLGN